MCYFDIWSRFVVLFFSPSGKGSALLPALWFKLQPNTSGHIHAHTSRRQYFLLLQLQPQSWSSSPCFLSPSGEGKSLENIGEIRISNEQNISVSFKSDRLCAKQWKRNPFGTLLSPAHVLSTCVELELLSAHTPDLQWWNRKHSGWFIPHLPFSSVWFSSLTQVEFKGITTTKSSKPYRCSVTCMIW